MIKQGDHTPNALIWVSFRSHIVVSEAVNRILYYLFEHLGEEDQWFGWMRMSDDVNPLKYVYNIYIYTRNSFHFTENYVLIHGVLFVGGALRWAMKWEPAIVHSKWQTMKNFVYLLQLNKKTIHLAARQHFISENVAVWYRKILCEINTQTIHVWYIYLHLP